MLKRTLGRTGISVSPLCLGSMMFGAIGNTDHNESIRIIHRGLEAGINFIDTADAYSRGESEVIVGKAIKGRRDELVIATKFHGAMGEDVNQSGNSRRWIVQAVEGSLRRLQTDRIDLYQIHRPELETDIDETLGALSDLVRQGKVLNVGSSAFQGSQIVEAQWCSEQRGHARLRSEQPPYSMLARGVESEVLPVCDRYGMGVISFSPLAGGYLSGRWRRGGEEFSSFRSGNVPKAMFDINLPGNQRKLDAVYALTDLAAEAGLTLIELALAFVVRHVAVTAAIIGPRTMEHLEAQLSALEVSLTDDVLDRIDEIVPAGVNVNSGDSGWTQNPWLDPAKRRRSA